jgi:hypothetical protein
LFATRAQLLEEAYEEQGRHIAYRQTNQAPEEDLQPLPAS